MVTSLSLASRQESTQASKRMEKEVVVGWRAFGEGLRQAAQLWWMLVSILDDVEIEALRPSPIQYDRPKLRGDAGQESQSKVSQVLPSREGQGLGTKRIDGRLCMGCGENGCTM